MHFFKEKKHALGGGSGGGGGGGGASVFPIVVSVVIIESERGSDVLCGEYLSLDFLAVSLGPMFQFGIVALVYVQEKVGPF